MSDEGWGVGESFNMLTNSYPLLASVSTMKLRNANTPQLLRHGTPSSTGREPSLHLRGSVNRHWFGTAYSNFPSLDRTRVIQQD